MDIDNTELVSGLLAERFKFYREPVPFLSLVQPGSVQVDGETWPALLLQNDAWWFPRSCVWRNSKAAPSCVPVSATGCDQ